ncbi:ABC transporter permease [Dysgonomonas sp. OttesenSCG-928-M03]|nr:ABC transporter permease [Dysgonomonas sp. OttesenSCG-928-M03]
MKVFNKNIIRYAGFLFLGIALFTLIWYIASILADIKALPSPFDVYTAYGKAFDNGIFDHTFASLRRIVIALVISLVLALSLGILMGYNYKVNKVLSPLVYFSYPLPKLAILPVVMILFGLGDLSKVIIIVLIIVLQLTINIRDAVKNIPKEDYDILTSVRASSFQKIRHITIPAILPEVFSSLRVALGIALSALFFTETFGTDKGLGFYITDSWMRIDYIQMFFGILTLSVLGLIIFILLDILNLIVCKWKNLL